MRTDIKQSILALIVASVLSTWCVQSVSAQRVPLRRYDVGDGLANNTVSSIYQDSKGFLWIGTQEGLSRFDGYEFKNYGVADGLGQQVVNDVVEDKQGRIWAGTNGGGVSLMIGPTDVLKEPNSERRKKFINFRLGDTHGVNFVNRLLFDSKNSLWCLTDFGLYRAQLSNLENLKFEPVIARGSINAKALIEDRHGRIWFGLVNELFEIRAGEIVSHGSSARGAEVVIGTSGERGDFIKGIVETKEGKILIATGVGLYEFSNQEEKPGTWRLQPLTLMGQSINSTFEDSSGRTWISLIGAHSAFVNYHRQNGSTRIQPQKIEHSVDTFAEDSEGNLWFGTAGGGLYKFGGHAFTNYTDPERFSSLFIADVFENHAGKLLVLLGNQSLVEISEQDLSRASKLDAAPSIARYSFVRNDNGNWIWGTGSQVMVSQPIILLRGGQSVSLKEHFSNAELSAAIHYYEDELGTLWLIKGNEVYHFNAQRQILSLVATLPDRFLLQGSKPQIMSDGSGSLWFGSSVGLCRLRKTEVKCFQPTDGLPETNPRALFVDSRGWLWIGLRFKGVSVTKNPADDNPQFSNYTNELPSNTVWAIAEDNDGRMYFGTERGVQQFDLGKNLWRHFNSKNGLSGDRINSLAKDKRGNIWICTMSGLTKFTPEAERSVDKPPPIYLSRVNIAGQDVPLAETGTNEIPLIELQSSRDNLRIEFVGLSFNGEDNLLYQYKLEGVDAEWGAPTKGRFVNYAHLGSGNYRFLVRAINRGSASSLTPASFSFRILPPVYLRWWFIALSILLVGSLVVAAYRYRVARLLELERVRMRIATDLHDDIGANLTRISILSEMAKQKTGNGKLLTSIADIARESVSSMNDIVWAVSPEQDRLLDMTRRMRQHAGEIFGLRQVELDFNAQQQDSDMRLGVGTRRDVLLIFKEAVNNAARHSECTEVRIDFSYERHVLRLQVSDNGKGFEPGSQGDGQGLRSMRRRAAALGGQLKVESRKGDGTTVLFELPISKSNVI